MQSYWVRHGNDAQQVTLPPADNEVFEGVAWGRADELDTPAYWALRCQVEEDPLHGFTSSQGSLIDEIGFCLLGGFGITAELNIAAFTVLKNAGVFDLQRCFSQAFIEELLSRPLLLDRGTRRYRFPKQRAARIATMREALVDSELENMPIEWITEALRKLPGVGPKTAAWIVRNHFGSDMVAILDVHVVRACERLKVFPRGNVLPRDYGLLEERFLAFSHAIGVRPSVLDAVMWIDMRGEPKSVRRLAA